MLNKSISVIILARGVSQALEASVLSVCAQTVKPHEVIVVGAITDGCAAALVTQALPVRLIHAPQAGLAWARNVGLAVAEGELVAFLDAGDVWAPGKLEAALPCFVNPETALMAHNVRAGEGEINRFQASTRLADEHAALLLDNFIETSTVVARTSAMRELGGFPVWLPLAAEYWLWLKLASRYRLHMLPYALTSRTMAKPSMPPRQSMRWLGWWQGRFAALCSAPWLILRPFSLAEVVVYLMKCPAAGKGREKGEHPPA